jgi:hypothetical protein
MYASKYLRSSMKVQVDVRRYRRIQIVEYALRSLLSTPSARQEFRDELAKRPGAEQRLGKNLLFAIQVMQRTHALSDRQVEHAIRGLLNIYHPARVTTHDIGRHQSILDAYNWLAKSRD